MGVGCRVSGPGFGLFFWFLGFRVSSRAWTVYLGLGCKVSGLGFGLIMWAVGVKLINPEPYINPKP